MSFERSELRAFPRLSCGAPAHIQIAGQRFDGQIIDISAGGCKFLPAQLAGLVAGGYRPGTGMTLIDLHGEHQVTLRWATPNYSALGCAFAPSLDEGLVPLPPETYLCGAVEYVCGRE